MRRPLLGVAGVVAVLVTGCGSTASPPSGSPDEPVTHAPGDPVDTGGSGEAGLLADTTGDAPFHLDSVSVRVAESFPVQIFLDITGSAPTPCHRVAYTIEQRVDEIDVDITTQSSDAMCAELLHPHRLVIPLGTAELPVTVVVNDGDHVQTVRP